MPALKASYAAAAVVLLPMALGIVILGPAAVRDQITQATFKSRKRRLGHRQIGRKIQRPTADTNSVKPNEADI